MISILIAVFLLIGASLMLLAAFGIIRLPDLPTRMHATTKPTVLGNNLIMIAVGFSFADPAVWARVIAIISFVSLTAPVAAHAIARAAYFVGVPLWKGTIKDDLKANYDPVSHYLRSGLEDTPTVPAPDDLDVRSPD